PLPPLPRLPLWLASLVALGAGVFLVPSATLAGASVAALLVTLVMRRLLQRTLGGFTGDTLGATVVLSELAVLLLLVASRG
ncbi:adenosylcobinamide-GDP ribazoletransferase, partial [Acetobacter oeni]|uniref:adenosylcobinamide-GDP ribazoletransferase n=1 Tax=Acetobacter oeni TaxID=304077 RepID=UPI002232C471